MMRFVLALTVLISLASPSFAQPGYCGPSYSWFCAGTCNGRWYPAGNYAWVNGCWYRQGCGYEYGTPCYTAPACGPSYCAPTGCGTWYPAGWYGGRWYAAGYYGGGSYYRAPY